MDRDGVAGKGVEHDHVEALLAGAFFPEQAQPAVTEHDLHLRRRIGEEGEVVARRLHHLRVELVEAEQVPAPPVDDDGPGPEPDDGDP